MLAINQTRHIKYFYAHAAILDAEICSNYVSISQKVKNTVSSTLVHGKNAAIFKTWNAAILPALFANNFFEFCRRSILRSCEIEAKLTSFFIILFIYCKICHNAK